MYVNSQLAISKSAEIDGNYLSRDKPFEWKSKKQGIIQQHVLCLSARSLGQNQIGKHCVQLKYSESHSNKDVLTRFGAQCGYDNNIIGTKLCMFANSLNSRFQRDCKNILHDDICNAGIDSERRKLLNIVNYKIVNH